MKASSLVGCNLSHTTDPGISGKITDILFDKALTEAEFFLSDIETDVGVAPLIFSPTVIVNDDGTLKTNAHPDDIAQRVHASIHRTSVDVDPTSLPSIMIGPFGNTIAPGLIAALFNARTGVEKPKTPMDEDGLWLTELQGHAVRAHVGDIGHVKDFILDDHLAKCQAVEIETLKDGVTRVPPASIVTERSPDGKLLLSIVQTGAPS